MMRRSFVMVWMVAAALSAPAQPAPEGNLDRIGPKAGEVAPDFEAPDQHGVTRRLSSLLGPNGAMLVFYRSADW